MADQLGFAGRSAPAHWWASFRTEDIDLAVYAGCDNDQQRKSVLAELRSASAAGGLSELIVPSFPTERSLAIVLPEVGSTSVTATASQRRMSIGTIPDDLVP